MLKTYWSDENKVTHRGLQVQWLSSVVGYRYALPIYQFQRIATKSYSYVGMNEATAKACQDAKLAQYTRNLRQWYTDRGVYKPMDKTVCVASVTMSHDAGGMWSVDIDVNEDQTQYYDSAVAPDWLFDLSLDYDESTPSGSFLRVSNVWRENNRLYLRYQQSIHGFDRTSSKFVAQNSTDGGASWTAITPASSTEGQMYFTASAWDSGLVRVSWDGMPSNSAETPTTQYGDTLHLGNPYIQVVGTDEATWRVQFIPDFANFNAANMTIETRATSADSWADITAQCIISGDRIVLPGARTDIFQVRATYSGVTSSVVTTAASMVSVYGTATATVTNNQVDAVTLAVTQTMGEAFDQTLLTVFYADAVTGSAGRTFANSGLTITGSDESRTVAFSVGNNILGQSMTIAATLRYDGVAIGTATATVHRS
jgi:hypothetical protein